MWGVDPKQYFKLNHWTSSLSPIFMSDFHVSSAAVYDGASWHYTICLSLLRICINFSLKQRRLLCGDQNDRMAWPILSTVICLRACWHVILSWEHLWGKRHVHKTCGSQVWELIHIGIMAYRDRRLGSSHHLPVSFSWLEMTLGKMLFAPLCKCDEKFIGTCTISLEQVAAPHAHQLAKWGNSSELP